MLLNSLQRQPQLTTQCKRMKITVGPQAYLRISFAPYVWMHRRTVSSILVAIDARVTHVDWGNLSSTNFIFVSNYAAGYWYRYSDLIHFVWQIDQELFYCAVHICSRCAVCFLFLETNVDWLTAAGYKEATQTDALYVGKPSGLCGEFMMLSFCGFLSFIHTLFDMFNWPVAC